MNTSPELTHSTLVPVDFSNTSMIALDHAIAVTRVVNEEVRQITLLHVIEGGNFPNVSESTPADANLRDALAVEGAINRLKSIIENYRNTEGISFRYIVASGKPYKKIVEVARSIEANLIVMGTHGSAGIQAFAGSNASRVIQTAPCPTVVVKEKPLGEEGYKNIVLPLDLSKETKQKVKIAAMLAKYYEATVHIVSMEDSDEFISHKLKNNLAQVKQYFEDREIKCTTTSLDSADSNFARQMLIWAQGKDADLVVIMAQQDKGFSEYIFGTVAQQIVSRSPIPVMAVQPREELEGVLERTLGSAI